MKKLCCSVTTTPRRHKIFLHDNFPVCLNQVNSTVEPILWWSMKYTCNPQPIQLYTKLTKCDKGGVSWASHREISEHGARNLGSMVILIMVTMLSPWKWHKTWRLTGQKKKKYISQNKNVVYNRLFVLIHVYPIIKDITLQY